MNKNLTIRMVAAWLPYAAIITLMSGIIYIATQQNFRATANDPQYQLVEDAAVAIDKGTDPKSLINSSPAIEISQSLAPFVLIYGPDGNIAASNAVLNGKVLAIPKGVLDYIKEHGSDAATWKPQPGVRQAMVAVRSAGKGYIVVAGRSLRKTEERIAMLGEQVLFGWACSLVALFILVAFLDWVAARQ